MSTVSNGFSQNLVILPTTYAEVKHVCLVRNSSTPTLENYKNIIPVASPENLKDPSKLIPLTHMGGPELGEVIIAETALKYGVQYEVLPDGSIAKDEFGDEIIAYNNGSLYNLAVTEDLKPYSFNMIVMYSTNLDNDTGYPSIAVITTLNNYLKLEKIQNFSVRYIIDVDQEIVKLDIQYWDEYNNHVKDVVSNRIKLEEQHLYLTENVMLTNASAPEKDRVSVLDNEYNGATGFAVNDNTLHFQIKEDSFDEIVPDNEIQCLKDLKINKFHDDAVRSQYLFFYYNLYALKQIILNGVKDAGDDIEDNTEFNKILIPTLRKHIKLGFSEPAGPFLYTWASTKAFIYIFVMGSNSNNNVDIYRVENLNNININDSKININVGKYLDRVYFTVDNILHVCVPQTLNKDERDINLTDVEKAKIELVNRGLIDQYIYDTKLNDKSDEQIEEEYNILYKDIEDDKTNSGGNIYYLTMEQLSIFLMSCNEKAKVFLQNGAFIENGTTDPTLQPSTSAKEFCELNSSIFSTVEKKEALIKIKYPIDKINSYIDYIDKLVKECVDYYNEYVANSIKENYLKQSFDFLKQSLKPDYVSPTTNKINELWEGTQGNTGIKNNVLKYYLKNGLTTGNIINSDIYLDYVENCIEILADIISNFEMRESILSSGTNNSDEMIIFYNGVYSRLLAEDATLQGLNSKSVVIDYLENKIYETDDIIDNETNIRRFKVYSKYRNYFERAKENTVRYNQYCLKRYMMSKEPDKNEQNRIEGLTSSMATSEFEEKYEIPLTSVINKGKWWDVDILSQLEELYKGVATTLCKDIYAFSSTDTFYYNGKKYDNVDITSKIKDIPFRYSFPYPNYIYNSTDSDIFVDPKKPLYEIKGSFKSKKTMEETLLIAYKDGEVENLTELDELTTLKATITVDEDDQVNKLTTVSNNYETEEDKDKVSNVDKFYESVDALPSVGELDTLYYIKDLKALYKYENNMFSNYASYPSKDGIASVAWTTYYKAVEKEKAVDILLKTEGNSGEWSFEEPYENIDYKIQLKGVNKQDTIASIDTDNNSTDQDTVYKFTPTDITKDYTVKLLSVTKNGDDTGDRNIVITQNGAELFKNKLSLNDEEFIFNVKDNSEVTISIEKVSVISLFVSYISSNDIRIIKILKVIPSIDGGDDTEEEIKSEELDFSDGLEKNIEYIISGKKDNIKISIKQGTISEVLASYSDDVMLVDWVKYDMPLINSVAYSKATQTYFQYNGGQWTAITQEEYAGVYLLKVYYVSGLDKYYTFDGNRWMETAPQYDLKTGDIYEVTNEEETITREVKLVDRSTEQEYKKIFTPITVNTSYNFSFKGITKIDDSIKEEITFILENGEIKFTPTEENKEVRLTLTDIINNSNIRNKQIKVLQKDTVLLTSDISFDETGYISEKIIKFIVKSLDEVIISISDVSITSCNGYLIKDAGSGDNRTLIIKSGNAVIFSETLNLEEPIDQKQESKTLTNLLDVTVSIEKATVDDLSVTYSFDRLPDGTDVEYYKWNGVRFVKYDMPFTESLNSCTFAIDGINVYYNLFIEGDKLKVIRDLFKNSQGNTYKVEQFDFSDIGDVVMILNYNDQGQNAWGGIFSRKMQTNEYGEGYEWDNQVVVSKDIKKCINWESYNNILWSNGNDTDNSGDKYYITDERINTIEALYEISKNHYENLSFYYQPENMRFSNALTLCFDEIDGKKKVKIFPKNIHMMPSSINIDYYDIKLDINNYFLIMSNLWMDCIYNRYYDMGEGENSGGSTYKKRFLTANRGVVVISCNDHQEFSEGQIETSQQKNGAYSFFNVPVWFNQNNIKNLLEPNDIPQKDI